jgi:hypothetical protein
MLIRSLLFSRDNGRVPDLIDVLRHRERQVEQTIAAIGSLDQMTDDSLTRLISSSLITPITLHLSERPLSETRAEQFRANELPNHWHSDPPGRTYPRSVVRVSIPFSGDPLLLRHCPSLQNGCPPLGEVNGNLIQFDLVFWQGSDGEQIWQQYDENLDRLVYYIRNANADVMEYNERLRTTVTAAFNAKLDMLTAQSSALDALGFLRAAPARTATTAATTATRAKRQPPTREHIITKIEQTFIVLIDKLQADIRVETFNQTNANCGDVNNEFQSS